MEAVRFSGATLLALRKERRWSQEELSRRSGVSISHISQLEKGTRRGPAVDRVYRLAEAFGVSMYRLLERGDRPDVLYPYPRLASDTAAEGPDSLSAWSRELQPDVLQFILSEQAGEYLALAKRLHDHRHSPRQIVQLIHEFIERFEEDGGAPRE